MSSKRRRSSASKILAKQIQAAHEEACAKGLDTYEDPVTGLDVFTKLAHERRGKCCGCGCRHCPFKNACKDTCGDTKLSGTSDNATDIEESYAGATPHMERIESERGAKPKARSVYTRTGDKGVSSLFNGERVHKSNPIFDALGNVDELSACVGLAFEHCIDLGSDDLCKKLEWCMRQLLCIGSLVATPRERSSRFKLKQTGMDDSCVKQLEDWMDEMSDALPTISSFLLPIGGKACAALHVCRATARRAERSILRLDEKNTGNVARLFMNRLSDFFFVAARAASVLEGRGEVIFSRKKSSQKTSGASSQGIALGDGRRRATLGVLAVAFLLLALAVHAFENPQLLSKARAKLGALIGVETKALSSKSAWDW